MNQQLDFSDVIEFLDDNFEPLELITQALEQLDACCDGAVTDDGIGFAGMHTRVGKKMAARMREGYELTVKDLMWIEASLPYYFNTQLSWVNSNEFHLACQRLIATRAEIEEREKQEKDQIEKLVNDYDYTTLLSLFMKIDRKTVCQKDRSFIHSLQSWRSAHTQKQQFWMRHFVMRYWDWSWVNG